MASEPHARRYPGRDRLKYGNRTGNPVAVSAPRAGNAMQRACDDDRPPPDARRPEHAPSLARQQKRSMLRLPVKRSLWRSPNTPAVCRLDVGPEEDDARWSLRPKIVATDGERNNVTAYAGVQRDPYWRTRSPATGKSTQTVTPWRATPHALTSPGAHRQPRCVAENLSLFGPVGGGESHGLVGLEVQNLDRTAAGLRHADSTACWVSCSDRPLSHAFGVASVIDFELRAFAVFAAFDLSIDVLAGQRSVRVCQFPGRASFVCGSTQRVAGRRATQETAMTWDSFLDAHPRSHLVVAWLHGRQRTGRARRAQFDLLKRIATALEPLGDWALSDANPREIYIAYERAADAAKLGTLVRAKPLGFSIQWLSQSAFQLDRATQQLIVDALKA
jgi:hypothetical protein